MLAALDTFMANITQFLIENKSMTCVDSMVSLINSVLDDLRKIEVFNLDIMAPDRFPTIAVDNCLSLSTARPVVQRFLAAAAENGLLHTPLAFAWSFLTVKKPRMPAAPVSTKSNLYIPFLL
jgi:hypothetical protein